MNVYRFGGKRFLDLLVAGLAGVALLPVILGVAVAVRLMLGSPVLFWQRRPGFEAQPFWLVKFRTMSDAKTPDGKSLSDEYRQTRFGVWLRRTSVDELPELWNVLRGEMSLVGPRPLLMEYLTLYSPRQARRHEIRPGITGWAQVNGRNAVDWERRFEMDVWYVDHLSFRLDLRILAKTILPVVTGRGTSSSDHVTMPRFRGQG